MSGLLPPSCKCRSTQVLTWAVIPVLQGYAISGAFTILGRVWHSLKRLWVFYLIIGALAAAGIVAALAAGKLKLATLPALVFTLSNTYGALSSGRAGWCCPMRAVCFGGCPDSCVANLPPDPHTCTPTAPTPPHLHPPTGLVVLVALLGYGMVEIPRIFWRRSFPEARLKWHYHRVGRAADKLTDASDELERVLAIVLATSQQIPRGDTQLRHYMDLIIQWGPSP